MSSGAEEDFIRALYHSLLCRKAIGDEEFAHWTHELKTGRSHAEVFRLFWNSEERQGRLRGYSNLNDQYAPGHFYSPIVDVDEPVETFPPNDLPELHVPVDVRVIEETLSRIASFTRQIPFSDAKTPPWRYFYNNTSFGYGDAVIYWAVICCFKPDRIVEVGGGFTSALALDAIQSLGLKTSCTFIEPYPDLLQRVAQPLVETHTIVPQKVQAIDLQIIDNLRENDILFIDSSHVVKTHSDVHFEITRMLPRLRPGVIVHFHDIFYPFEYPQDWIYKNKYSWNEIYMLHAFLLFNDAFEIIYFNDFVAKKMHATLTSFVGAEVAARIAVNPGGGLWLKRK